MPTAAELSILLKFRDQASGAVKQAAEGMSRSLKQVGETIKDAGQAMRQFGRNAIQAGAIITGPFLLALREAGQHNAQVRDTLRDLSFELSQFSQVIAQAILPIIQRFVEGLKTVREWFVALSPETRDAVLRMTFLSGVIFLVAGAVAKLGANLVILGSGIFSTIGKLNAWVVANNATVLAIAGTVAALVVLIAMFQQGDTFLQKVGRTLDLVGEEFKFLAHILLTGLGGALTAVVFLIEQFIAILAKLPGPQKHFLQGLLEDVKQIRQTMGEFTKLEAQEISKSLERIETVAVAGGGAFEGMAKQIDETGAALKKLLGDLSKLPPKQTVIPFSFDFKQMKQSIQDFWNDFTDLTKQSTQLVTGFVTGLQSHFEQFFQRLITGQIQAGNALKEFAKSFGAAVANMIVQLLALATTLRIIKALGGASFLARLGLAAATVASAGAGVPVLAAGLSVVHQGGLIPSFQHGGEVPALLESGEFVVNRAATSRNRGLLERINRGEGEGGMSIQNIFIINAIDEASFRGKLQAHADLIEAMFQRAMRRNSGPMREAVRI